MADKWNALRSATLTTRYGLDCYAYCMLAAGHLDLVCEAALKNVDLAPLIPLIENAGGVVSTWDGKPAEQGGNCLVAATPELGIGAAFDGAERAGKHNRRSRGAQNLLIRRASRHLLGTREKEAASRASLPASLAPLVGEGPGRGEGKQPARVHWQRAELCLRPHVWFVTNAVEGRREHLLADRSALA